MADEPPSRLDRLWELRKTRTATTLLKFTSIFGGLFLVLAGIIGLTGIFQGQIVYFVGSLYAIIFGCTVLIVEVRDKVPMVSAAYQQIDVYLKFMTLQRGKGLYYLGVGLLVLYIGPDGTSSWGLNNVAALLLAIIGVSHTCGIPPSRARPPPPRPRQPPYPPRPRTPLQLQAHQGVGPRPRARQ
jgi:hypothetical protein